MGADVSFYGITNEGKSKYLAGVSLSRKDKQRAAMVDMIECVGSSVVSFNPEDTESNKTVAFEVADYPGYDRAFWLMLKTAMARGTEEDGEGIGFRYAMVAIIAALNDTPFSAVEARITY